MGDSISQALSEEEKTTEAVSFTVLHFDESGTLYGASTALETLYVIDKDTGVETAVGPLRITGKGTSVEAAVAQSAIVPYGTASYIGP